MVLYSKCAYGSQFSGEKNNLKIQSFVAEILSKNPVSFFLGHPVDGFCVGKGDSYKTWLSPKDT